MKKNELEKLATELREELYHKTPSFIRGIDWEKLRDQKEFLISQNIGDPNQNFDGIIHLIDALQDYAVDIMGLSEEEVFNSEE